MRTALRLTVNMMEPGPFQQSFYPDGETQFLLSDDDHGALPAYATTLWPDSFDAPGSNDAQLLTV